MESLSLPGPLNYQTELSSKVTLREKKKEIDKHIVRNRERKKETQRERETVSDTVFTVITTIGGKKSNTRFILPMLSPSNLYH